MASDGEFWVSRVLATIEMLEEDTKHVSLLVEADEDELELRQNARKLLLRLREVRTLFSTGRSRSDFCSDRSSLKKLRAPKGHSYSWARHFSTDTVLMTSKQQTPMHCRYVPTFCNRRSILNVCLTELHRRRISHVPGKIVRKGQEKEAQVSL